MSTDDKGSKQELRRVGVYDRPASADRFRNMRVWILVLATLASAAGLYFFFNG